MAWNGQNVNLTSILEDIRAKAKNNVEKDRISWVMPNMPIIGINVNGIADIQAAINNYIQAVNIEATGNLTARAFFGNDVEQAIAEYNSALTTYACSFTNSLREFSEKLNVVQAAWTQASLSFATKINTDSSTIK